MKTGKRRAATALAPGEIAGNFTRGVVATALLTAVQERWAAGTAPPSRRKVVRYALQGGTALAAGAAAADALRARDYATALLAVAAGSAGVLVVEHLLNSRGADAPDIEESRLG
ncbi:hypothetical protein [Azospirillum sp. TSO22-1]|uniref:hypothetical protein n=1 Tax=Azospirillum sp. TSO22-1 TaxID=716789 RepID=UPI000D61537F|nr:hypothetical protein [Azospirillum sp. TSO22-1]PWC44241.1 hypothetical protein TSO221_18265 [Azospirillum sp. TSO22-1]